MQNSMISENDFDVYVKEWKNMDRSTDQEREEANKYYKERIFPGVIDKFIDNNTPEKKYGGLILTVGFTLEPLILSILAIKPDRLGLVHTEETKAHCEETVGRAGYAGSIDYRKITGSDINGIYQSIWDLSESEEWREKNIAVDITGGKNSMAAGAALAAAAIRRADISYVDTDQFLPAFSRPEPGSEYLKILESPRTLLRISE